MKAAAPVAVTEAGRLHGTLQAGVVRFRGVPYAAAPAGALRFAEPQPHPGWAGIRDATLPGPNAPQVRRPFAIDLDPIVGSGWRRGAEYLSVNVWTPEPGAGKLPVLVFIHGGAWVAGDKDAPVHDGTAFARSGVVCITINYRLGIEGFLPIPGVPTNLGLRDQLAALAWVQRNAPAFGGDPAQITVAGESAGALSLANLLGSPASAGLLRRVIVQSGHGSMVRSSADAQPLVHALAAQMGVAPDLTGFRQVSVEAGVAALEAILQPGVSIPLRDAMGRDPSYGLAKFLPVVGDDLLPEPTLAALGRGAGADVELLIGTTREEANLYLVPNGVVDQLTEAGALHILAAVEPRAAQVLDAYRAALPGAAAGVVFSTALSDLVFRLPARRFAAAHHGPTHVYDFEWRSPACGGALGACHALELPFVFDTLASCTGPAALAGPSPPQELAARVHRLWVDFIAGRGLPWPAHAAGSPRVRLLAAGSTQDEAPLPAEGCGC